MWPKPPGSSQRVSGHESHVALKRACHQQPPADEERVTETSHPKYENESYVASHPGVRSSPIRKSTPVPQQRVLSGQSSNLVERAHAFEPPNVDQRVLAAQPPDIGKRAKVM